MMSEEVVVRPFREEDMVRAVRVFTRAYAEKMRRLTGLPEEDWADLMIEAGVLPMVVTEGSLVAEVEGSVVGLISLDWRGRHVPPMKGRSRSGRFSWWLRMKVRFGQWVMSQRAGPGEVYVQYIGVDTEAQGKGVGSSLIERGEEIARERGLARYTLYVATRNQGAKRLYERMGFREKRRVRSRTTRWLLGYDEWVFMVKRLAP